MKGTFNKFEINSVIFTYNQFLNSLNSNLITIEDSLNSYLSIKNLSILNNKFSNSSSSIKIINNNNTLNSNIISLTNNSNVIIYFYNNIILLTILYYNVYIF